MYSLAWIPDYVPVMQFLFFCACLSLSRRTLKSALRERSRKRPWLWECRPRSLNRPRLRRLQRYQPWNIQTRSLRSYSSSKARCWGLMPLPSRTCEYRLCIRRGDYYCRQRPWARKRVSDSSHRFSPRRARATAGWHIRSYPRRCLFHQSSCRLFYGCIQQLCSMPPDFCLW